METRFVKIAPSSYLQISDIKFTTNYEGMAIIKKIREMKKENRVIDMTHGNRTLCVIFLKDDTAILVNTLPETINKRIDGEE